MTDCIPAHFHVSMCQFMCIFRFSGTIMLQSGLLHLCNWAEVSRTHFNLTQVWDLYFINHHRAGWMNRSIRQKPITPSVLTSLPSWEGVLRQSSCWVLKDAQTGVVNEPPTSIHNEPGSRQDFQLVSSWWIVGADDFGPSNWSQITNKFAHTQ